VSSPESRAWARRNAQPVGDRRCDVCYTLHPAGDLEHAGQAGWACPLCRACGGGQAFAAVLTWLQRTVDMDTAIAERLSTQRVDAAVQAVIVAACDVQLLAWRCGVPVELPWPGPELAAAAARAGFAPSVAA